MTSLNKVLNRWMRAPSARIVLLSAQPLPYKKAHGRSRSTFPVYLLTVAPTGSSKPLMNFVGFPPLGYL